MKKKIEQAQVELLYLIEFPTHPSGEPDYDIITEVCEWLINNNLYDEDEIDNFSDLELLDELGWVLNSIQWF